MRPVTLTTAVGALTSAPCPMDIYQNPFNVGLGLIVVDNTGSPTFTVEHTFDDPYQSGGLASATWFNHSSIAAQATSTDGNYQFAVRAIRLVQASGSGSASGKLIINQSGIAS